MVTILLYPSNLLYRTWNKVQIHTTAQPITQANLFSNINEFKISTSSCSQVYIISLTNSTPTHIRTEATRMNSPPEPSKPSLESAEENGSSDSKLCTAFKQNKYQHKWLFSHLTFSDKLGALYSEFKSGEARAGTDSYYRAEVRLISAAWIIKYNCGMQYIHGGGMVPGKAENQNFYWGELGGKLGVMCEIQIIESILDSTTLVVDRCDNISTLILASIYLEAVTSQWK